MARSPSRIPKCKQPYYKIILHNSKDQTCVSNEPYNENPFHLKRSQPPTRYSENCISCQAAVCTRCDSAFSWRPSSSCTRRYCRQSVTASFCAPCCSDDLRAPSRIEEYTRSLCVTYMLYLCTSNLNVQHCIEKTPPRSPPPTNGIRWKSEQRF
jgi:hypothetical protein